MIHLLLLTGAAGASSSASIEEKSVGGVATGSSVEIDAPGRALQTGKCCKRAAKHKRKKLQLKAKWQECEEAAAAPAEGSGSAAGGGQCTQGLLDAARQAGIDSVKQDFTAADIAAAKQDGIDSVTPEDGVTQADVNAALQTAEIEKQKALALKDEEIATHVEANYVPKADVEANYVLKTDCFKKRENGATCERDNDCDSGYCVWAYCEDPPGS